MFWKQINGINCVRHEKNHKSKLVIIFMRKKHFKIDLKSREKKHLLSEYMNTLNTNTWILKMQEL